MPLQEPSFYTLITVFLISVTNFFFSTTLLSAKLPLLPLIVSYFHSTSGNSSTLPPGPLSIPIFRNWLQIRVQHHALVLLVETKVEGSNPSTQHGVDVARVVEVLGLNKMAHPVELNPINDVRDLFVAFHGYC
jgi:hypothetical protein